MPLETSALCPGDPLCGRQARHLPGHRRWPSSPIGLPLFVTGFLAYTFGLRHTDGAHAPPLPQDVRRIL